MCNFKLIQREFLEISGIEVFYAYYVKIRNFTVLMDFLKKYIKKYKCGDHEMCFKH